MEFGLGCWALLAGVLLYIVVMCQRLVGRYRTLPDAIPDDQLPKVGVLLTLRGADPFLEHCLRGLFSLDYPRHEIRVIVDSEQDPAWSLVERVRQECQPLNVLVQPLTRKSTTCSLRMDALLQGVDSLDGSVEVIAWLDADTIPYRQWLRDLVAPLRNPDVAISHGLRWFNPRDSSMGTLVRHIWNAGAVLQMCDLSIAWGGSCAIRRSSFEAAGLPETWSRIMFEDTCTANAVLKIGQQVAVATRVTMLNMESTSLSSCVKFIARQLLNLRLYHRAWRIVFWSGMAMNVIAAANLIFPVWAAVQRDWRSVGVSGLVWLVFGLVVGLLLLRTERCIQELVTARGESFSLSSVGLIPAGVLVYFVYGVALLRACLEREITWRGIHYRIDGPFQVTRLNYEPFVVAGNAAAKPESL